MASANTAANANGVLGLHASLPMYDLPEVRAHTHALYAAVRDTAASLGLAMPASLAAEPSSKTTHRPCALASSTSETAAKAAHLPHGHATAYEGAQAFQGVCE